MWGSQGLLLWGWRTVDGNSCPDHGESPCKFWDSDHSAAWWTYSCSSGWLLVGVTLSDGPFGRAVYDTLFSSVCGSADGKQARSMFSRGPGGARDQREVDSAKMPCRLGMPMATTCTPQHSIPTWGDWLCLKHRSMKGIMLTSES